MIFIRRNAKDIIAVIIDVSAFVWTSVSTGLDISGLLSVEAKWMPIISLLVFALIITVVRGQDIANTFREVFYLGEGPGHREHRQVVLGLVNSGLSRATVSRMS